MRGVSSSCTNPPYREELQRFGIFELMQEVITSCSFLFFFFLTLVFNLGPRTSAAFSRSARPSREGSSGYSAFVLNYIGAAVAKYAGFYRGSCMLRCWILQGCSACMLNSMGQLYAKYANFYRGSCTTVDPVEAAVSAAPVS